MGEKGSLTPANEGQRAAGEIVIVCNSYPPEIGAAPTRIYNLAQLLKRAGYRVEVFCALPNYPTGRVLPGYRGKLWVEEVQDGIVVKRIPIVTSTSRKGVGRVVSMATHTASLWAFLLPRLLRRRPRLVIVSSPPLPVAASGVRIAKLAGCKVLLNVSDLWPLSALELGAVKKGALYRALEGVERRMYRLADAVLGQSEEILRHISARLSRPLFLYRNLPAQAAVPPRLEHGNHPRRIVYVGQLGPVQGVAEICASQDFARMGVELHLYGDGPERARIRHLVSKQNRSDIVLHDPVPLARLSHELTRYDAALVPLRTTLTGAVPSKLFTAVSAGLPVIFCGGGEGAQLVEKYRLGWTCPPGDADALSAVLRQVACQSETALSAVRARCMEACEQAFSKRTQDENFLLFLAEQLSD